MRHVYVHVPFCTRRCAYCDFSIAVRRQVPVQSYIDGLMCELNARQVSRTLTAPLDTLYFGGGTPSRLGGEGVAALLDALRGAMTWSADAEVTLEANPEDITPASAAQWKAAGISRLSIGVQSFDDTVLRWMHRVHDAKAAVRAVHVARDAGLTAFSLDLIFAMPGTLARSWSRDLDETLALDPDHISLYGLTVEPYTPLGRWSSRGDVDTASDERYADEFLMAHARLTSAGYEHYEVSNFAKPGKRAVHNSAYWSGRPYLGIGPSAHGFDGDERRWNVSAYAAWLATALAGRDPVGGAEQLTADNRAAERVYLGLRTTEGLTIAGAEIDVVAPWVEAGWLEQVGDGSDPRVRCTPNGWLVLDKLAGDLTAVPSRS
ncbi:MAG: radical SAM family heme chaperone HemW [Gemmatimonadaceae bacterium]|nr:radical SAM family heme chaperone HemW [Gemmatimonadaceae bacterium]